MVCCQLDLFNTFIVDDSPLFLDWLKDSLRESKEFRIIGEASTASDATEKILRLKPDLVLADFFLPDGDGLELAEFVKNNLPESKVVILSSQESEVLAALEISNQAVPFLSKSQFSLTTLLGLLA